MNTHVTTQATPAQTTAKTSTLTLAPTTSAEATNGITIKTATTITNIANTSTNAHQYRYKRQQQKHQHNNKDDKELATQTSPPTVIACITTTTAATAKLHDNGDTNFPIDKPDDENVLVLAHSPFNNTNAYSCTKTIVNMMKDEQGPHQGAIIPAERILKANSSHHNNNNNNNSTELRLRNPKENNTLDMNMKITVEQNNDDTESTNKSQQQQQQQLQQQPTNESSLNTKFDCLKHANRHVVVVDDDDDDVDDVDDTEYDCNTIPMHNNIPLVEYIHGDSGEQSDISLESSEDSTDSSTPTTADIADLTAANTNSTIFLVAKEKPSSRSSLQNGKFNARINWCANVIPNSNNNSIADDNLSASIATTTTDVDIDNITVASPNMSLTATSTSRLNILRSPQPSLNSTNNANLAVNIPGITISGGVGGGGGGVGVSGGSSDVQHQHPSAAYLQSGGDSAIIATSTHKRSLSAASYRSTNSQHPSLSAVSVHSVHSRFYNWIRWICVYFKSSGIGEPSVYHALVVIFLEFFAWGLLTMPVISVLNQTFPDHTFLMNGLVMGIKGILSFLSAPLIGALSDIWGRKFFLLITVFFTCAPIPLMTINSWWFFAMISISGIFAVTFSVVFAYVADVTTVEERSRAYGLVSATFAASLVISPALGAALMEMYSDTLVVALATAIAVLDVFFILVAVPESLPEKVRPSSWGAPISWEQADPFAALRKVGTDHTILMQCVTVLLSYLPEAGQYSCIFVYLKLKMGFNSMEVAIFIAVVGILSIVIQVTLGYLMRVLGAKRTIILGLVLEMLQLLWYGFGSQKWMMWAAGVLAALGSITYPAISAFVSIHSTPDRQGAVQGMVTGMRGLCNGLGPAMFGVIFYLFNVDLNDEHGAAHDLQGSDAAAYKSEKYAKFLPGPPFVFGAFMVILAILVAIFIPEGRSEIVGLNRAPSEKKRISLDVQYEIETGHKATGPLAPLMRSDSLAQL